MKFQALIFFALSHVVLGYYISQCNTPPPATQFVSIPDSVWVEGPPPTVVAGPPPSRVIEYRERLVVDTTRCIHPPAEIRTVYLVRDTAITVRRPILRAPVVSITRYAEDGTGQTLEYRIPPRPWGAGVMASLEGEMEPGISVYGRYKALRAEVGLWGASQTRVSLSLGLP